jgi:hypothetical protein
MYMSFLFAQHKQSIWQRVMAAKEENKVDAAPAPLVGCILTPLSAYVLGSTIETGVLAAARNTIPQIYGTPYEFRTWRSLLEDMHLSAEMPKSAQILAEYKTFLSNFMVSTPDYRLLGPRKGLLMVHTLDNDGEWTNIPVSLKKPTPAVHGMIMNENGVETERDQVVAPHLIEIMDVLDRGMAKPPLMRSSNLLPVFNLCSKFWNKVLKEQHLPPSHIKLKDALDHWDEKYMDEHARIVLRTVYDAIPESGDMSVWHATAKDHLDWINRLTAESKGFNPEDFERLHQMAIQGHDDRPNWEKFLVRDFLPRYTQSWDLPEDAPQWMRAVYAPVDTEHLYETWDGDTKDGNRKGVLSVKAFVALVMPGDVGLSTYMVQRCSDVAQRFLFFRNFNESGGWSNWAQFVAGPRLAELHPEYKKLQAGLGGLTTKKGLPEDVLQHMAQMFGAKPQSVKMFQD